MSIHKHPFVKRIFLLLCLSLPLWIVACGGATEECKSDTDCNNGQYCDSTRCFDGCTNDSDCASGETCQSDHRCKTSNANNNNNNNNNNNLNNETTPTDGGPVGNDQPVGQTCGNGAIDTGEECDGNNINGQTCMTKGFTSGNLRCNNCRFDTSNCQSVTPPKCNNGAIDTGEECDGTNLNNQTCQSKGFTGGTLKCNNCRLDTSGCTNTAGPKCGDNKREGNEECEGSDFGGATCQSRGFDGGTLKCTGCKIDVSGCTNASGKKKFGQLCNASADCDSGLCAIASEGDPGYCTAKCSDTQACPTSPPGAQCALRVGETSICGWPCTPGSGGCPTGLNCNALGNNHFCTGSPAPTPPKCGNNQVESGEACDGTNLNNQSCQTQGFASGTLKCNSCQFDTSGCSGTGTSTPGFGQKCNAGSCPSGLICVKFTDSLSICTAKCSASNPCPTSPSGATCRFQLQDGSSICGWATTSGGPPVCGNGSLEFGEDCDGTSMYATCKGLGYTGGTLKCSSSCKFDTSSCSGTTRCSNLPPAHCTGSACSAIIPLSPMQGPGYNAYHGAAFSYMRREAFTYLKYATAAVDCVYPNTKPLGWGDMGMQGGLNPATQTTATCSQNGQCDAQNGRECRNGRWWRLRHPCGTHVNGSDIDVAYYQVNQLNNNLRAVCAHTTNGQDQYHCTADPIYLDAKKTAFFIAKILQSGKVRVIGVDGKIGPKLKTAFNQLLQEGMITQAVVGLFNQGIVTWEETDQGRGWFRFHHHHAHISFR